MLALRAPKYARHMTDDEAMAAIEHLFDSVDAVSGDDLMSALSARSNLDPMSITARIDDLVRSGRLTKVVVVGEPTFFRLVAR